MQNAVQARSPWKKHQNGGATPLFGFQPPKSAWVAPALRHGKSCRLFFPR